jgi:hypothetical protein
MPSHNTSKKSKQMPPSAKVQMINLANAPTLGSAAVLHNANNLTILWNSNATEVTTRIHVIANVDPGGNNDNPNAPVVLFPNTYRLFFRNPQGEWSTSHSVKPYGPDGDNNGLKKSPPYLARAQNGQLVGVTVPEAGGGYIVFPYITNEGWKNVFGRDLSLRFFINDLVGSYADNVGSVDCDVVLVP